MRSPKTRWRSGTLPAAAPGADRRTRPGVGMAPTLPRGALRQATAAAANDPLSLISPSPPSDECHLAAKITRSGTRGGIRLPHIISDRSLSLSAACARSAASAEVDGAPCGQVHVLRSRFRARGYRAGQVLRSAAGSLLLRMAVLKNLEDAHPSCAGQLPRRGLAALARLAPKSSQPVNVGLSLYKS